MKRKYFIHKFLEYFLTFTMPIILMGMVMMIYTSTKIRDTAYLQSANAFRMGSEILQGVIDSSAQTAVLFNNDPGVAVSFYKVLSRKSLSYEEIRERDLISASISSIVNSYDYVESCYIYFPGSEDLYYRSDRTILPLEAGEDTDWYSLYLRRSEDEGRTMMVRRYLRNYGFEKEHDVITLYRPIRYFNGVSAVNMNARILTEQLEAVRSHPSELLIVTDGSGSILLQSSNAAILPGGAAAELESAVSAAVSDVSSMPSAGVRTFRIGSARYAVHAFRSGSGDLSPCFVSLTPERELYSQVYEILYFILLGIFLSALVCLIFSYYLANKNFRQISRLMDILWETEKGVWSPDENTEQRGLDEYNLILNQVIFTYLRNNKLTQDIREAELNRTLNELKALQLQINPHFFFNTLQSIDSEIIRREGFDSQASTLVHYLSDILRYCLEDSAGKVPLEKEIEISRTYFRIEQFNFPGQAILLWDYPEEIGHFPVFRLLLQPLIENSLRHGVPDAEGQLIVRIKIYERDGILRFHILDTGYGMDREKLLQLRASLDGAEGRPGHIGLRNTNKRLLLNYPGSSGLTIISSRGRGTCISFSIPV